MGMSKQGLAFLKKLTATMGPSGYEEETARVFREEASAFADEARTDVHGNTIVRVKGKRGGGPVVMLCGHYDEIGFLVTFIDDKGFLRIAPIGGWDPQIPQGQRVRVRTAKGDIPGVLGKMPIHVMDADQRKSVTQLKKMWVDIGAKDRKDAEKRVDIGDPIVIDQGLAELGNGLWAGRAFDDRAGAWAVLEAARRLAADRDFAADVYAVGTVQEEIGSRGAITSSFGIAPEVGIAVDVTFATDHPMMSDAEMTEGRVSLGGGPVLSRGANINPVLFSLLAATAKKRKIAVQRVADGRATPTDADPLQISRAGVAAALVSVPLRYMHTPGEVVSLDDLDATAELLAQTVRAMKAGQSWVP